MSKTKDYWLPLARDYVKKWTVVDAIRELFQNAIDSDSPLAWKYEEGTLTILSVNAFLPTRSLLLGTSTKSDDNSKIGAFGEGYKIALLVLTREEKSVTVYNHNKVWEPSFKFSADYEMEMLCVTSRKNPEPPVGLSFVISDITEEEWLSIVRSNLHLKDSTDFIPVEHGRILCDRPGQLYVSGLFVCNTSMHYGYDLKPEYITLERDRQTVSNWDLVSVTKAAWIDSERVDQVTDMIFKNTPDVEYISWDTPEVIEAAVYKAFRENHPGAMVAKNQEDLDKLVKQGFTKVVVMNDNVTSIVSRHADYKTPAVPVVMAPHVHLEKFLTLSEGHLRKYSRKALKELIVTSKDWVWE